MRVPTLLSLLTTAAMCWENSRVSKLSPRLPESKGKVLQSWLLHRLDDNGVRNYRATGALHDYDSRQDQNNS